MGHPKPFSRPTSGLEASWIGRPPGLPIEPDSASHIADTGLTLADLEMLARSWSQVSPGCATLSSHFSFTFFPSVWFRLWCDLQLSLPRSWMPMAGHQPRVIHDDSRTRYFSTGPAATAPPPLHPSAVTSPCRDFRLSLLLGSTSWGQFLGAQA